MVQQRKGALKQGSTGIESIIGMERKVGRSATGTRDQIKAERLWSRISAMFEPEHKVILASGEIGIRITEGMVIELLRNA